MSEIYLSLHETSLKNRLPLRRIPHDALRSDLKPCFLEFVVVLGQ